MGHTMKFLKFILLILAAFLFSACGGDSEETYDYNDISYIDWTGSVNGTLVIDATDDVFEFEYNTGYLHFGNTTYTNAWVDIEGDFYIDSILVGAVYYILSIDNEVITALISNNGHYIDIYGPESNLAWTEATTTPIYALTNIKIPPGKQFSAANYSQTAKINHILSSLSATAPILNKNAFTENLSENSENILKN